MAEKKELREFRELFRAAIGDRTQLDFAAEAGLSAAHVSRLLNLPEIKTPTVETLKKIASKAKNGVTLKDLLESCGYDYTKVKKAEDNRELKERKAMDPVKRTLECIADFQKAFDEMPNGHAYHCKSVFEAVSDAAMLYQVEDVSFSVGEPQEVEHDARFLTAEESAEVEFNFKDEAFQARFSLAVFFYRSKRGAVYVLGAVTDKDTLMRLKSPLAYEVDTIADPETSIGIDPVYTIKYTKKTPVSETSGKFLNKLKSIAKEERVSYETALSMMFGMTGPTYLRSIDGIGFYIDEVPEYRIVSFLKEHRESFAVTGSDKLAMEEIEGGMPAEEAFRKHKETSDNHYPAWGDALEQIIRNETGIRVECWTNQIDIPFDNRPCLLLAEALPWEMNDVEQSLSQESAIQVLDRYALELQCEVTNNCQHWIRRYYD